MNTPFEPYTLAGIPLRNRFVRSATVGPYGTAGVIGYAGIRRYQLLAEQQVGLIITEMTFISPDGQASRTQAGICDSGSIVRHRQITEAVHQAGGKIFIQLNHGGAASLCDMPPSPSGVPSPYTGKPAKIMTPDEIAAVTMEFANAAARAQRAGYDGIQLHCAHGYLLSQFISPFFNHRDALYGGSAENRFRFPAEVIAAVKAAVGPEYPVCIKLNSNAETEDDRYEDALLWMGQECARLGVCAIEVSGHDFTPLGRSGLHAYYLDRAARLRQASGLPVMLVGGIRTAEDIRRVLGAGIDLVSMSRPFLCQPDLVFRFLEGTDSRCVSCSRCFAMLRKFDSEGRLCIQHDPDSDRFGSYTPTE